MILERRKLIQVTMPAGVSKWVPWSTIATLKQFDFTCDSGASSTPYSSSGASRRRIRATPCTPNSASSTSIPQRKIRLRFRRQSPDQQQHDAIMDPTNQEDDQWWALWTFRHRHNFTCNYRNFSSRFWTQKSYIKNFRQRILNKELRKGIKDSIE